MSKHFFRILCLQIFFTLVGDFGLCADITTGNSILIARTTWDETYPKAAYDPNTKQYLVSWLQTDNIHQAYIKGATLKASVRGPVHNFAQTHYGHDFLLAFDSLRNAFLLVWETGADSVPATVVMISESATVLGRNIASTRETPFLQAIAFHPINRQYLVGLPFFQLSPDGQKVGDEVDSPQIDNLIIIPDNQSSNYFTLFRNPSHLAIQLVDQQGRALSPPRTLLLNCTEVSAAFNTTRREFLIAYRDVSGATLKTVRVNASGLRLGSPRLMCSSGLGVYNSLQRISGGYLLAYERYNQIVLQRLNDDGVPSGKAVPVTPAGAGLVFNFTIVPGERNNFLIVWSGGGGRTLGDVYAESFSLN